MGREQIIAMVLVLSEVQGERERQYQQWGEQRLPDGTGGNGTAAMARIAKYEVAGALMRVERTGGAVVAGVVVAGDVSVVIDISRRADGSMWGIAERVRFVRDSCRRLYQRRGEKRRPLLQLVDEAARFAPQIVRSGETDVAA